MSTTSSFNSDPRPPAPGARLRIVLVEPREAGNVGAVARVMKNFAFRELWIVGEHPELHPLAGWWASGAEDVVAAAHFAPSLHHALADAHVTVATTSSRGRTTTSDMQPSDVAHLLATMDEAQTLALVFGRENSGLTSEEVKHCQRSAIIPTDPSFPTMNLAQSVGVFCYELSTTSRAAVPRELATAGMLARLHERAQAFLVEVGYLHGDNPDRIYDDLRLITARADLDAREVTILLGILHQMEWKLAQERDGRRV
jgi:tRNA/rRNA methyltransferase